MNPRPQAAIYGDMVIPLAKERLVENFDLLVQYEVAQLRFASEAQAQCGILKVLFPADVESVNTVLNMRVALVALEEAAAVLRKWQAAGEPVSEICRRVRLNHAHGSPWRQAAEILQTHHNMMLEIESSTSSAQVTLDETAPRPHPARRPTL